jgi:hypothetical protein
VVLTLHPTDRFAFGSRRLMLTACSMSSAPSFFYHSLNIEILWRHQETTELLKKRKILLLILD